MAATKKPKLPRKIKKAAFSDRWNYRLTKYRKALNLIKDVYPTLEGAAKEDAEHFKETKG